MSANGSHLAFTITDGVFRFINAPASPSPPRLALSDHGALTIDVGSGTKEIKEEVTDDGYPSPGCPISPRSEQDQQDLEPIYNNDVAHHVVKDEIKEEPADYEYYFPADAPPSPVYDEGSFYDGIVASPLQSVLSPLSSPNEDVSRSRRASSDRKREISNDVANYKPKNVRRGPNFSAQEVRSLVDCAIVYINNRKGQARTAGITSPRFAEFYKRTTGSLRSLKSIESKMKKMNHTHPILQKAHSEFRNC